MIVPVFDLDGTLLDSDHALASAYLHLGVPAEEITFGHVVADECRRLGIDVADYLDAYDPTLALPFAGVTELVARLGRWAICSNKVGRYGRVELDRLGWHPEVALFAESFSGPKSLEPVLTEMGCGAEACVFVGDTAHDSDVARSAGVRFALAGWNPRAAGITADVVLAQPLDLLELLSVPGPA
ncbi:MAG: HAD family hydrolase [Acidimicrobiales bacterium]